MRRHQGITPDWGLQRDLVDNVPQRRGTVIVKTNARSQGNRASPQLNDERYLPQRRIDMATFLFISSNISNFSVNINLESCRDLRSHP